MKKPLFLGFLCSALLLGVCACSDGDTPGVKGYGKISPTVDLDGNVKSSRSRVEAGDITVNDLSVKLTSADGSYSNTWESVAEFPTDQQFKVGEYTFEAFYGDEYSEGFEKPYFHGSQTIEVNENITTPVSLTAELANTMVTIQYTDNFRDYMSAWSAQLHSNGGNYIDYVSTETRPAYLRPGDVEIYVDYTKQNGKSYRFLAATFPAAAKTHYTVTIDLNQDAGAASITVIFDEATVEEPVTINLDDIENAPAPVVTYTGFNPEEAMTVVPGYLQGQSPKFSIVAQAGLKAVKMTTISATLLAQGWPAEVDLCHCDAATQQRLTNLGFAGRGLFKNPDKMATIDLTGMIEKIAVVSGDNTTTITLVAEDNMTKASEPITLTINAEDLHLELANARTLIQGDNELTIDLLYNGGDPTGVVDIQYFNDRATWSTMPVTYTAQTSNSRAVSPINRYTAVVTTPDATSDLKIRAIIGAGSSSATTSVNVTIDRESAVVTPAVSEGGAYATKAIVDCTAATLQGAVTGDQLEAVLAAATVYVSADGGASFSRANFSYNPGKKSFTVKGLSASSTYQVKVSTGTGSVAELPAASFTTEAAAQLPNGNCDGATTVASSGNNWQNIAFPDGWGSNNPMTTSQGTDRAWKRISGTIASSDAVSGSAVLLRTVGWGTGNTATMIVETGTINYADAGLYHLGSSRSARPEGYSDRSGSLNTDDLECGIAFSSRPSALTFKYKYAPKNAADKGQAYIWVKDASGNIIAEGVTELTSASSYTTATINLSYSAHVKAAKIYVRFLSTCVPDAFTKSGDWFSAPSALSYSSSYVGSQLLIDDIVLTY